MGLKFEVPAPFRRGVYGGRRLVEFSEDHMFTMLERGGWEATFHSEPHEEIQSHFLCRPTDVEHPPRPAVVRTPLGRRYGSGPARPPVQGVVDPSPG